MTDERASFEATRARLEEILAQVKKKDTSLEQSLDLLEEGVRLANECNELIDQTSWRQAGEGEEPGDDEPVEVGEPGAEDVTEDAEAPGVCEPEAVEEGNEPASVDTDAGGPAAGSLDDGASGDAASDDGEPADALPDDGMPADVPPDDERS